jgi:hypothetical protein
LGDSFFAKLLGEDQSVFAAWRSGPVPLGEDKADVLRDLWRTVLHLLSFQNFHEEKVRALLELTAPPRSSAMMFFPPWAASSLKQYLENHGSAALPEVQRWVESFRFGDPYISSRPGEPCLSTRP